LKIHKAKIRFVLKKKRAAKAALSILLEKNYFFSSFFSAFFSPSLEQQALPSAALAPSFEQQDLPSAALAPSVQAAPVEVEPVAPAPSLEQHDLPSAALAPSLEQQDLPSEPAVQAAFSVELTSAFAAVALATFSVLAFLTGFVVSVCALAAIPKKATSTMSDKNFFIFISDFVFVFCEFTKGF
jgi:hypothetical protein